MKLPEPVDDLTLVNGYTAADASPVNPICPWVYHRIISEVATVHYRFQRGLRQGSSTVERLVTTANEELARIIDNLPPHLQPDWHDGEELDLLRNRAPWIEWQRIDLCNILLQYRILVNRTLEESPAIALELPNLLVGARSICVNSARTIVAISTTSNLPASRRRYW